MRPRGAGRTAVEPGGPGSHHGGVPKSPERRAPTWIWYAAPVAILAVLGLLDLLGLFGGLGP
jgi:hypothetical protein